jgi:predicted nucleotidyltransferase
MSKKVALTPMQVAMEADPNTSALPAPARPQMKIAVIIAEFNPFHNGHEYIIRQARAATACTHLLVVQSGNFVQRAEPAVIEKHLRAKSAVLCGADAVLEIPTAFATGNAEVFAKASVQIANVFPHVTHLVFGVEDDDLPLLNQIATAQVRMANDFEKYIRQHLKQGISYDDARCEVIKKLIPQIPPSAITKILKGGNNILAVEYLKELYKLKSRIKPVAVLRTGAAHTDTSAKKNYSSALSLRNAISVTETPLQLADYIPKSVVPLTEKGLAARPKKELFESSALFSALTMIDGRKTYNISDELYNLFEKHQPVTQAELETEIPTRRYSVSRVKRVALHAAIGVTKNDIGNLYRHNYVPYTNLLAIRTDADELFAELCSVGRTPVVVRGNRNKPISNSYTKRLLQIDKKANILYAVSCKQKFAAKPVFVTPKEILKAQL